MQNITKIKRFVSTISAIVLILPISILTGCSILKDSTPFEGRGGVWRHFWSWGGVTAGSPRVNENRAAVSGAVVYAVQGRLM